MKATFNVMDLIRCPYDTLPREKPDTYIILPKPLKGTLLSHSIILGICQVKSELGKWRR